jgi:hypothetical protein
MGYGGDERRDYFRIAENLLVELRQVTPEEATALEKSLRESVFPPDTTSRSHEYPQVSEELYTYLEALDKKLNLIIELLSGRDESFERNQVEADISGSGMRYQTDIAWEEGTLVELRIAFPFSLSQKIRALGKVVRSSASNKEGKASWDTAIAFVVISEKDRDGLISYIFSRERQRLQAARTSKA